MSWKANKNREETMKNSNHTLTTRRQFIARIAPVCAFTCLGSTKGLALNERSMQDTAQASGHKFDAEIKLTYRKTVKQTLSPKSARVYQKI